MNLKKFLPKQKLTYFKYILWSLCLLSLYVMIQNLVGTLSIDQLIATLQNQSLAYSGYYFLLGMLTVSATTLYDFIVCHDFDFKMKPSEIFQISWLANSAINFAEEQVRHKEGVRYLLYKYEGITAEHVSFITVAKNMFAPNRWELTKETLYLTNPTHFKLFLAFFVKWIAQIGFFLYCVYSFSPDAPYFKLTLLFILAMFVCYLLGIPSGIGIFDMAIFYGSLRLGLSPSVIFAVLVVFRLFYYVIPWFLTMIIVSRKLSTLSLNRLSPSQKNALNRMSIRVLAALTFFAGLFLILSASFPDIPQVNQLGFPPIPASLVQFYRLLTLGIGLLLLIVSKGIWNKVLSAYYATFTLLIVGTFVSLLQGPNIKDALILLLIMWALKPTKHIFYRPAAPLTVKSFIPSLVLILMICCAYSVLSAIWLPHGSVLTFSAPLSYSVIQWLLVVLILIGASLLLTLLSAEHLCWEDVETTDLDKLRAFLKKYEGNSMTHLLFLRDKKLFYTMDDQVLIAFRPHKDKLIILGDPIGDSTLFSAGINAFRVFADQHGMTPIFYEISEALLPMYHENGFKFLKLGEEATLHLCDFTLAGKKGAPLRTIKNKMLRGELTFELLQPPFTSGFLEELHVISDLWLDGRKEKTFSLGAFDEDYMNLAPIGIVKQDDIIIAFATIMPTYTKHSVSIDLMRLIPDPPNGTMDALFIGLIEWAIEEGYEHFILGKAPLSNVGYNQFSPTKEKIVKYIYHYGNRIYSFKGLRRYKEKFYPEWKGIYLAYPKNTNLSVAILQLTKMISGNDTSSDN